MLEVIEIQQKASQGRTEPYLCRLSDDKRYYIKGPQAGTKGLINEAVCAFLGRALQLSLPPHCCAFLPQAILRFDEAASRVLGASDSMVFASELIPDLLEVTPTSVLNMPAHYARDLFLFDYWIRNEDRTMTENGGNPNLFYQPASNQYVVLDHNLAFDSSYNFNSNANVHLAYNVWFSDQHDALWRTHYSAKLAIALQGLAQYAATLPAAWLEEAPGHLAEINDVLSLFNSDEFWEVLI
ncbi:MULTISPECIES: HipA family kinase [unclassified Arsukibacterium]|uniref:HipA family kinase n=1 Tax=unclassified Arsukibacterium TaxID=2635278 RepID=UPI000C390467|nr:MULTISPECIES: HipA family kinase [unclassified Arsukibacterium]MAA94550.1 hypothetical protein [Rheinheimera sp.]MBM32867.1 hypothetical protein [Rheinheimera sp.]HAW94538.1 hypothetical protein [Candidatus Azambacteria bacterium]